MFQRGPQSPLRGWQPLWPSRCLPPYRSRPHSTFCPCNNRPVATLSLFFIHTRATLSHLIYILNQKGMIGKEKRERKKQAFMAYLVISFLFRSVSSSFTFDEHFVLYSFASAHFLLDSLTSPMNLSLLSPPCPSPSLLLPYLCNVSPFPLFCRSC